MFSYSVPHLPCSVCLPCGWAVSVPDGPTGADTCCKFTGRGHACGCLFEEQLYKQQLSLSSTLTCSALHSSTVTGMRGEQSDEAPAGCQRSILRQE